MNKAIGLSVFIACLTIGILGDLGGALINFLPGIGGLLAAIIITPIGAVNSFIFNWASGRKLTGKSLAIIMGCMAIECLPIINALPGLTTSILMSKASHVVDDTVKKTIDSQ